jgi:hypothetical protein
MTAALPTFGASLADWLTNRAGYAMPDPNVGFSFSDAIEGATSTHDRGIIFSREWEPEVKRLSGRFGRRGQLGKRDMSTLKTVLHEMLHQPLVHREPDWYGTASNGERLWEEAAAVQAADDLLPAAARQLFGHRAMPARPDAPRGARVNLRRTQQKPQVDPLVADRTERERAYQQLSVFGSGAKRYTDPVARRWRRDHLNASTAIRNQMREEAMAKRGTA